jgi:hypothetical protein
MAMTEHKDTLRNKAEHASDGPQIVLPGKRRRVSGMV